jgi:hypothetical protein
MGGIDGAGELFSFHLETHFAGNSLILHREVDDPFAGDGISLCCGLGCLAAHHSEKCQVNESNDKWAEDVVGHAYKDRRDAKRLQGRGYSKVVCARRTSYRLILVDRMEVGFARATITNRSCAGYFGLEFFSGPLSFPAVTYGRNFSMSDALIPFTRFRSSSDR